MYVCVDVEDFLIDYYVWFFVVGGECEICVELVVVVGCCDVDVLFYVWIFYWVVVGVGKWESEVN